MLFGGCICIRSESADNGYATKAQRSQEVCESSDPSVVRHMYLQQPKAVRLRFMLRVASPAVVQHAPYVHSTPLTSPPKDIQYAAGGCGPLIAFTMVYPTSHPSLDTVVARYEGRHAVFSAYHLAMCCVVG